MNLFMPEKLVPFRHNLNRNEKVYFERMTLRESLDKTFVLYVPKPRLGANVQLGLVLDIDGPYVDIEGECYRHVLDEVIFVEEAK